MCRRREEGNGQRREQSKTAAKPLYSLFWQQQQQGQPVDSKIDPADLSFIQFTTSGIELKTSGRREEEKDLRGVEKGEKKTTGGGN